MKHLSTSLSLLTLAFLLGGGGRAAAQYGDPYGRPRVSPYVNLLRTGNTSLTPGVNYFGIVRPEQEFRSSINQLQQQVLTNQQLGTGLDTPAGPLVTGAPVGFQTHLGYFQNLGGGGQPFQTTPGSGTRGLSPGRSGSRGSR